jgi:monolysocardiolipin acyltransferase
MESKNPPLVLPFYHEGMSNIQPSNNFFPPKIGKKLSIRLGEIIDFENDEVLRHYRDGKIDDYNTRILITKRIQDEIQKLKDMPNHDEKSHTEFF